MTTHTNSGESRRGYHRLATLAACKRKYGLRYGLGLEGAQQAPALALGSLVHLAAMHHYRRVAGQGVLDPIEAMRQAPESIAHQFTPAVAVWERYVQHVTDTGADDEMCVLDVEREFEARIGGRLITARLDLVFARDGQVIVMDHKTAGGDLASEIRAYEGSGQIALLDAIGAGAVAPLYGWPFAGVEINAVGTAKQDPPVVRRRVVPPREWQADVVGALGGLLVEADAIEARTDWRTEAGVFVLAPAPEACKTRFRHGKCEFYDVCREGPGALRSPHLPLVRGRDAASAIVETAGL